MTNPDPALLCAICGKPIDLKTCKTDAEGHAVHPECIVNVKGTTRLTSAAIGEVLNHACEVANEREREISSTTAEVVPLSQSEVNFDLMRRFNASRLSGALLIGALCAQSLWAADDVQKQVSADYQNKILTLRQPYSGEKLRFGPDGQLIGEAKAGPWTVDGRVEVKRINFSDHVMKIEGRRVWLFFDPFTQQLRDIASVRDGEKATGLFKTYRNRQLWKRVTEQPVEIDVELASESPDDEEISLATEAIFLNSSESMLGVLPSFWQSYFAGGNSELEPESNFHNDLYRAHQDGILAPTPLLTPNPQYSEAARLVGFEGRVEMSLVVDKDGNPRGIQVVEPAGLGLDEESVNAVQQWKFQPGQKQARPVNVQLSVETTFRLY